MILFDFHHHNRENTYGIYNLEPKEIVTEKKFSVGIHPKDIDENWEENFEKIKEISLLPNCVAIGECGLDGLISVNEKQKKEVFEKHILWANQIKKPVIIHCVTRFSEIIPFQKTAKIPLVIHGFNKKKNNRRRNAETRFLFKFWKICLTQLIFAVDLKRISFRKNIFRDR